MGAGRKTETHRLEEKYQSRWTVNCSIPARNLRKSDLGGVIFGCKHHTIQECKTNQLFGFPAPHFSYVKNVTPGLTLFLFNYSDRKLHGIFQADSPGKLNINPYGWTGDEKELTPYPAQVRVRVQKQCLPLLEEEFSPIIADNYYQPMFFWFELDHTQTRKLVDLFISSSQTDHPRCAPRLPNTNKWIPLLKPAHSCDTKDVGDGFKDAASKDLFGNSDKLDLELEQGTQGTHHEEMAQARGRSHASVITEANTYHPLRTWSSLFKSPEASGAIQKGETLNAEDLNQTLNMQSSTSFSLQDRLDMEWEESTSVASSRDRHCQQFDASADGWCVEGHEEPNADGFFKLVDSDSYPEREWEMSCEPHISNGESDLSDASKYNDAKEMHNSVWNHMRDSLGNHDRDADQSLLGETDPSLTLTITEFKPSDIESWVVKEIRHLRNQLAYRPTSSSGDHFEDLDFESSKPLSESDHSILIAGGYDGHSWLSDLSSYSPSHDLITSLSSMTVRRAYTSAAKLNGELYLFGGVHENMWYDTVESYNPTYNQWCTRPSLNQRKGSLAGISVFEKLFAIGGGNGAKCFSEVEMLDLNIGKWIFTKSMQHERFAPAVAEINGTLYVAGRYDGRDYLKSVERFDPREDRWISAGSMSTKRGCHSLVALNEKLYALGGYNGTEIVSNVEVFDPRVCSWMMGESMRAARGYSGSVVIAEKIYVVGGVKDSGEVLDTIECYKDGYGWKVTSLNAVGKRCFFSAIVL